MEHMLSLHSARIQLQCAATCVFLKATSFSLLSAVSESAGLTESARDLKPWLSKGMRAETVCDFLIVREEGGAGCQ